MTNQEIKELIYDALFNRDIWTKTVPSDSTEIRTRCPFCGDSEKRLDTGHLYIKIDVTDNSKIMYHCFRCEESGLVTPDTLEELEISDIDIKAALVQLNRTGDSVEYSNYINGSQMLSFDYEIDGNFDDRKVKYLSDRLGIEFTDDMLRTSKVVTSLKSFIKHNKIKELMCNVDAANAIESDYIGFLSHGNSHILFRNINPKSNLYRWIKYPLTTECQKNKVFYSMASEIDIFSDKKLSINLTEGVLDIISARYLLGYGSENAINIAVGGKGYRTILSYLLSIGVIGSNVTLNIFADNDMQFNKDSKNPTDLPFFKKVLSKMKNLYGATYIYYNITNKDIGVPMEKIHLEKHKL